VISLVQYSSGTKLFTDAFDYLYSRKKSSHDQNLSEKKRILHEKGEKIKENGGKIKIYVKSTVHYFINKECTKFEKMMVIIKLLDVEEAAAIKPSKI
jgi:hypothetical protein